MLLLYRRSDCYTNWFFIEQTDSTEYVALLVYNIYSIFIQVELLY